jgi:hypothetical protein
MVESVLRSAKPMFRFFEKNDAPLIDETGQFLAKITDCVEEPLNCDQGLLETRTS